MADQDDKPAGETKPRLELQIAPRTIFFLLGVIGGVWLLGQLRAVILIVVVALILVGTFDPGVAWLERRGFGRGRALALVFMAAALGLVGIVVLMMPPLVSQFMDLVANAPKERERLVAALADYSWAKPFIAVLEDLPLENLGTRAANAMLGYSTWILEMIGYGISTLFLSIYLLADPVRSKGFLYALVPRTYHVRLATILLELKVIVGGYMRGQMITSLSMALFVFAILAVFGAENALAIALFAGLTDIIPFVGAYIASTPVVIAVIPFGATATVIVVVLMVLYQEFESRILIPRVYGRTLRLPPAIIVVALLVGGTLGGILGALLALPIAAGASMLIRELRVDLPGESPREEAVELDEKAAEVYTQMTEGVPAAEAGQIAEELATVVKRNEAAGSTTISTQELPVVRIDPPAK